MRLFKVREMGFWFGFYLFFSIFSLLRERDLGDFGLSNEFSLTELLLRFRSFEWCFFIFVTLS